MHSFGTWTKRRRISAAKIVAARARSDLCKAPDEERPFEASPKTAFASTRTGSRKWWRPAARTAHLISSSRPCASKTPVWACHLASCESTSVKSWRLKSRLCGILTPINHRRNLPAPGTVAHNLPATQPNITSAAHTRGCSETGLGRGVGRPGAHFHTLSMATGRRGKSRRAVATSERTPLSRTWTTFCGSRRPNS